MVNFAVLQAALRYVDMVFLDFEYKEIVRANNGSSRLVIIGYIEQCRSGYFFRPKGRAYTDLKKTKRFKTPSKVRAYIRDHYNMKGPWYDTSLVDALHEEALEDDNWGHNT